MRFGYKASAEQFAPTKLLNFAVEAEQAGFDLVFVSDHFQPWKHTDGHAPFRAGLDGSSAGQDRTGRARHFRADADFRLHPSVVAHAFGTLGAMFPGRVILGVGTGRVAQ